MLQLLARWKIAWIVVAVLVIAGTIHFTSLSRTELSFVEALFRDLVSPVQTLLMRANHWTRSVVTSVGNLATLSQENEKLQAKVLALQQQVYQLAEYQRENQWLREALDFKETVDHTLLVSEVIGRSPTNWLRSITINKGANHGVASGMAVVSGVGTVGTVQSVTARTATVILNVDPQSAMGGLVQSTGDILLVEGDPSYSGLLLAKPLNNDAKLAVGDVVVTSGLSRLYPKGLPIGEVVEVTPSHYDLSFTALIKPFVDFTRLEYVFVVLHE